LTSTDHQRLLVKLARLYHEGDLTQGEIADRLRLSRQKVQRHLREAREQGVVQTIIRPLTGTYGDLEKDLEDRYELREALVVETSAYQNQSVVAREVGGNAAEYLRRIIQPRDRFVISWGGSLLAMVNSLSAGPKIDVDGITVIQGLGGLVNPSNEIHASDLTRRLANVLGGEAQLLPAPGVAASHAARDAFYSDLHTVKTLQLARTANVAFMGIGVPRHDSILVQEGSIVSWQELESLHKRGAVGDINLRYFDQFGHKVESNLDERVIGLTLDELKHIDLVVGVAGGARKLHAIQAALRGALVDVLITDHMTAGHLLKMKEPQLPKQAKVTV
jgi:DNA-binding transcriptional regulator LsrR (DeoR family)